MMAFEFGVQDEEGERNPVVAMLMSARLFLAGSLPSVLPYIFTNNPTIAVALAITFSVSALFLVGAIKTRTTHGNWIRDGMENLVIGGLGAALSFGIGFIYKLASAT